MQYGIRRFPSMALQNFYRNTLSGLRRIMAALRCGTLRLRCVTD